MKTVSFQRLSEVSQAITAKLSPSDVLQTVVNAIAEEVAGVDLVGYFERQSETLFVGKVANKVPMIAMPGSATPVPVPITSLTIELQQDAFVRQIVETRRSLYIEDAQNDSRPDPVKVQLLQMESLFGIPVEFEGELFGVVFLHDVGRPMELPPETRMLVESFVAMGAVAINNARLFCDQQRLIQVTQQLAACLSIQDVIDTSFRNVVEVAGVETAGIHLLRHGADGAYLEPTYLKDTALISREEWHEKHRQSGVITLANDAMFREAVEQRHLVAIEDVYADPRPDRDKCRIFDIYSLMVIPLVAGGEVLGTIAIPSIGKKSAFPERVKRICRSIADSTAIALKNAYTAEHMEDLVRQKTVELTEANTKLQDLVRELQSLDHMKSDFIASISHELRTPIHIAIQILDLFEEGLFGDFTSQQEEYLDKLREQIANLGDQVEDLLDFSKLESGTFQVNVQWVAYADIVDQAVKALEPADSRKNLDLQTEVVGRPCLSADPKRIQQILTNLLSNAIKFTPDGGRVSVRVEDDGNFVKTSVTDTGVGIPPDALERIFDRFYQVDSTATRRYSGTGLGLSITKSLVELHGGSIAVDSAPGRGSTFSFNLPKEGNEPCGLQNTP